MNIDSDFEIVSDIEVRHRPTGATWTTYRYKDPEDSCSSLTESAGKAGDGDLPTIDELRPKAVAILRQLAKGGRT